VLRCALLCAGVPQVSPEERERAKRVVYGIVYGQTPWGLAQQLVDQGVSTAAAQGMIDSFLARFQGGSHRLLLLLPSSLFGQLLVNCGPWLVCFVPDSCVGQADVDRDHPCVQVCASLCSDPLQQPAPLVLSAR
jgi:hypothetical protein